MQYPKLSCQLDQRSKVCGDDKKEIRKLHKQGLSLSKIGEMFNLSKTQVYWISNKKAYDKQKKDMRERIKQYPQPSKAKVKEYYHKKMERIKKDPEYYEKIKKYRSFLSKKYRPQARERVRERYRTEPEFRKKMYEKGKNWQKNNPEKVKEYAKKYQLKNKKKIQLRHREYQKRPYVIAKRRTKKAIRKRAEYDKKRYYNPNVEKS